MSLFDKTECLNFVLLGPPRSGLTALQTALDCHPQLVCHADLLARDPHVAIAAHKEYFNDCEMAYHTGNLSPEAYLRNYVFDRPMRGEKAVGVKLTYNDVHRYQLWDFLAESSRLGDFYVIHITRNPIVCMVSEMQASRSGIWAKAVNDRDFAEEESMLPVSLQIDELTSYCRTHDSTTAKVEQYCPDRFEFSYFDMLMSYPTVMSTIFKQFGVSDFKLAKPSIRRLRNRGAFDRISNLDHVKASLPFDVRHHLECDVL